MKTTLGYLEIPDEDAFKELYKLDAELKQRKKRTKYAYVAFDS